MTGGMKYIKNVFKLLIILSILKTSHKINKRKPSLFLLFKANYNISFS